MSEVITSPSVRSSVFEDRLEWLEWRRAGIGSSDAAAIAGLDPFKGPLAVFLEKTGRVGDRDETEYQRWGQLLQNAIITEFELRTGLCVPLSSRQLCLEQLDARAHFRATIDGFVHEVDPVLHGGSPDAPLGILEVKTVAGFKSDAWADGAVPEHFQIQVLHQLAVTGLDHAWIAVLFGGQRLEFRELDRADHEGDLVALLALEDAFWARVVAGQAPLGDGSAGSTDALRAAYAGGGGELALPLDAGGLLVEREQAKAEEKEAAVRAAAAEQSLMALLGDAEIGLVDGRRRVSWKRHERASVDLEALRKEQPELVRQHTSKQPYRQLRFIGSKADSGGDS